MQIPPSVRIAPVTAEQLVRLRELARTTFTETFAADNDPMQMERYMEKHFSEQQLLSELQHPCSEFYFAWWAGQAVGYIKLNQKEAQTELKDPVRMELERIYVLQAYWGTGVGQQLLDFAVQRARSCQMQSIWLGVWEHNHRALRFYHRNGFVVFDRHDFLLGDEVQTDLMMQQVLS